jgi:hypothetical protein
MNGTVKQHWQKYCQWIWEPMKLYCLGTVDRKHIAANPSRGSGSFSMGIANAYYYFILVDVKQTDIFQEVALQSVAY